MRRMRAVIQRVSAASVSVGGEVVGAIERSGLLILLGFTHDDDAARART
ncbi:MAG: D-aminoacyl-tRNA deacylase, partial [Nocardioidaceae bacterium]